VNQPSVDWQALGFIAFKFLVGMPPFNDDTMDAIFDNILNLRIPWDELSIGIVF